MCEYNKKGFCTLRKHKFECLYKNSATIALCKMETSEKLKRENKDLKSIIRGMTKIVNEKQKEITKLRKRIKDYEIYD